MLADQLAGLWAIARPMYVPVPRVADKAGGANPLPGLPEVPEEGVRDGWQARFRAGYLAAGGDPALLAHLLRDVEPCEWGKGGWHPGNGYLSRFQFEAGSWRRAGGGDPADDEQVGGNVARWIGLIGVAAAGTSAGWPVCWWRGQEP